MCMRCVFTLCIQQPMTPHRFEWTQHTHTRTNKSMSMHLHQHMDELLCFVAFNMMFWRCFRLFFDAFEGRELAMTDRRSIDGENIEFLVCFVFLEHWTKRHLHQVHWTIDLTNSFHFLYEQNANLLREYMLSSTSNNSYNSSISVFVQFVVAKAFICGFTSKTVEH